MRRTGIVLAWVGFALATQRWLSWDDGFRLRYALDVRSYESIAEAAPSLPSSNLALQHAERFPVHWIVGIVADASGGGLPTVYRVLSLLCLGATAYLVARTLARLDLPLPAFAVAMGLVVASAFPVHYLLAAPGMISDSVFLLGLSAALLGFVEGRFAFVAIGLVVAVLGRQTAVPVAIVAAGWVAAAPAWRSRRVLAVAALVLPLGTYAAVHAIAATFAFPGTTLGTMTISGASPRQWPEHVARTALGVLVPAAVVAGAWWRTRGPLPRGSLVVAAAVIVQPLVLAPDWALHNEPRLAALSAPALALAAGALLRRARLTTAEATALCTAVAAASLHRLYTDVGVTSSAVWGVLTVGAAVVSLVVLAGRRVPLAAPPTHRPLADTRTAADERSDAVSAA